MKGTFNGTCEVCVRPRFVRGWHLDGPLARSAVCTECWFGILDGPARRAEAQRAN